MTIWVHWPITVLTAVAFAVAFVSLWTSTRLPDKPEWPNALLISLATASTIVAPLRRLPTQNVLWAALIIAVIGGAAAIGISLYTFGVCSNEGGSDCPSLKSAGIILPLAGGIGVGALIDAGRHKRESVVYEQTPRLSVSPMVLPHGYGVQVRMAIGRR